MNKYHKLENVQRRFTEEYLPSLQLHGKLTRFVCWTSWSSTSRGSSYYPLQPRCVIHLLTWENRVYLSSIVSLYWLLECIARVCQPIIVSSRVVVLGIYTRTRTVSTRIHGTSTSLEPLVFVFSLTLPTTTEFFKSIQLDSMLYCSVPGCVKCATDQHLAWSESNQ